MIVHRVLWCVPSCDAWGGVSCSTAKTKKRCPCEFFVAAFLLRAAVSVLKDLDQHVVHIAAGPLETCIVHVALCVCSVEFTSNVVGVMITRMLGRA